MEILVLLMLMLMNAFLALTELSVVSSRKGKLAAMVARKVPGARTALALAEQPDRFLSAVQVGITMIGVLSGVYGGATLSDDLGGALGRLGVPPSVAAPLAYILIVGLLTYLSVVIGELVPKRLALTAPERFACLVAPPMRLFATVASPLVYILSRSSRIILRLLGIDPDKVPVVTEEDALLMVEEASRSGAIAESEQDVAERAFRLADRPVTSIMTPRTEVLWLDLDAPPEMVTQQILASPHSHLPVCRRSPDNVVGILKTRDWLKVWASHLALHGEGAVNPPALEKLVQPPAMLGADASALEAIELLKREKSHFAIVLDQYGGMEGLVTSHDILEALVGHVPGDKAETDAMVRREDGSLLVSGWVSTDEVFRELGLPVPPGVERYSVAAYILALIGRIPETGEVCETQGVRLEVVDRDGARLDRVLASLVREDQPAEPPSS